MKEKIKEKMQVTKNKTFFLSLEYSSNQFLLLKKSKTLQMTLIEEDGSQNETVSTDIDDLIDETNILFESVEDPVKTETKEIFTEKKSSNLLEDEEIEVEIKKLIPNMSTKKKDFYRKWYKFMESIQEVPEKLPVMGFKPLDLYNLYYLVISQGGYGQVIKLQGEGIWIKIFKKIDNYKSTITNSSVRLKNYYQKYLLQFELKYFDSSSFNPSKSKKKENFNIKWKTVKKEFFKFKSGFH
jgi:hypothetical protein